MPWDTTVASPFLDLHSPVASFEELSAVKVIQLELDIGTRRHFLAAWACKEFSAQGLGYSLIEAVTSSGPVLPRGGLNWESGIPS